jgi:ElaB/YqjD/DUF883 family membrane-anchored ribosome-binding protein
MESMTDRGMTEANPSMHMQDELQSLRSGFDKLRADVAELFSHAFGFGRSGAEMAREYGADTMENLKSRFNDLRDRGTEQMHSVERKIEENPMSSAMIAFGVGFILAKMMHRRH